jgi:hypothetical protein
MTPEQPASLYTDLNRLSLENDWLVLEAHFHQLALDCSGAAIAAEIQACDLQPYTANLIAFLTDRLSEMSFHGIKGLYFEYEPENAWKGTLYVVDRYTPFQANDDRWARQYFQKAIGPKQPQFARLYQQYGGIQAGSASQVAASFFLSARTVAAFGRAVLALPQTRAAVCIGHPGQPVLTRIYERPA